jgi:hypothetical protein
MAENRYRSTGRSDHTGATDALVAVLTPHDGAERGAAHRPDEPRQVAALRPPSVRDGPSTDALSQVHDRVRSERPISARGSVDAAERLGATAGARRARARARSRR